MRVLVLGAQGILGRQVVSELGSAGHHVEPADVEEADITDLEQLRGLFACTRPRAVVNCAAYTAVDKAESDPERAFRVNGLGVRNMALCCDEQGATLFHVSTDYVFDGTAQQPYDELAPTSPLGVYGRSKLQGEWYAQRLCRRFAIIRTSWLYGPGGRNFITAILGKAKRGEALAVVGDQHGCPTYAVHLASRIRAMLEAGCLGLYHVTGSGSCTWYDLAREILDQRDLSHLSIRRISSAELERPAPRPTYAVLDNLNLRVEGIPLAPHWREGVHDYLRSC
jgi:dTDP-4-dehydrorhamnose reductase